MKKLYSFDVFDTCLVRACGDPTAVFDALAREVLPGATETQRIDFAYERKKGEERARRSIIHDKVEEVTFDQIYEFCDFSIWTKCCKKEIQEIELRIERQVLLPVVSMIEKISLLRKKGHKIAYISDMYLPSSFIKEVLESSGFFEEGDALFVSCDTLQTKRTGSLFRYVADQLSVRFGDWNHSGDNLSSDVRMPRKLGIKANHIEHKLNEYEERMSNMGYGSSDLSAKVMASICKALRLSSYSTSEELFASTFIAPIFVPFVFKMLQEARIKGVRRLFFFARDAYIFYCIAQQLSSLFPEIELKYLYVSRKSLYLPGLKEIDFDNISAMFWNFRSIHVGDIIERLQIDGFNYTRIGNNVSSDVALRLLLEDSEFVRLVEKKRSEQRSLAIRYFVQEGLGDTCCGVVDLTGTRKCHIALNRLLKESGLETATGFYFSVMDRRIPGNDYWSMHFEERFIRNIRNCTYRPQDLFEQYFCLTDQKRTACYKVVDNSVVPVFEECANDPKYCTRVSGINQQMCCSFAHLYSLLLSDCSAEFLSGIGGAVFSYFYYVPSIEYLDSISQLVLSESSILQSRPFELNIIHALIHRHSFWRSASIVHASTFPKLSSYLMSRDYSSSFNGDPLDYLLFDRLFNYFRSRYNIIKSVLS